MVERSWIKTTHFRHFSTVTKNSIRPNFDHPAQLLAPNGPEMDFCLEVGPKPRRSRLRRRLKPTRRTGKESRGSTCCSEHRLDAVESEAGERQAAKVAGLDHRRNGGSK